MKKRILCYGDSNTFGTIPNQQARYDDDVRWAGVMEAELGDAYKVLVEGQGGRALAFDDILGDVISGLNYFRPCVLSQAPLDLIIIMLGTNDLKTYYNITPGAIAYTLNRYEDVLKIAFEPSAMPKLLIVSPIHIKPEVRTAALLSDLYDDRAVKLSRELAPAFESTAKTLGAHFMDAARYAHASDEDGLHMLPDEHRKLGIAMAAKVREILD